MKILDLFSGIGGFSLGLEKAGMQTAMFCEIEPFCRRVLAKHWPGVPIHDDVRTMGAELLARHGVAVDLVCGGFPCQDLSVAGKGAGLTGSRSGLWFEYLRVIEETRPRWVVIENVPALRSRGLDIVLGGLAALGYDAEWHCIPAAAVGAPHRRDRVWIVANARRGGVWPDRFDRKERGATLGDQGERGERQRLWQPLGGSSEDVAHPAGGRRHPRQHVDERRYGGAEQCAARGGGDVADTMCAEPSHRHAEPLWAGPAPVDVERCCGGGRGASDDVAEPGVARLQAPERQALLGTGRWDEGRAASECGWRRAQSDLGGTAARLSAGLDGGVTQEPWERGVPRVARGVPDRVARLRALGNAVVPQISEIIGRAILAAERGADD